MAYFTTNFQHIYIMGIDRREEDSTQKKKNDLPLNHLILERAEESPQKPGKALSSHLIFILILQLPKESIKTPEQISLSLGNLLGPFLHNCSSIASSQFFSHHLTTSTSTIFSEPYSHHSIANTPHSLLQHKKHHHLCSLHYNMQQ